MEQTVKDNNSNSAAPTATPTPTPTTTTLSRPVDKSITQQLHKLFKEWHVLPPEIPAEFEQTLKKVSDTQFNTLGIAHGVDLYSSVDWKQKIIDEPNCSNFLIINKGFFRLAKLTCTFEFFCGLDHVILLLQLFNYQTEQQTVLKLSKEVQVINEKINQHPQLLQGASRLFILDNRCGANTNVKSGWMLLGKPGGAKWETVDFHVGNRFSWIEAIPLLK